MSAIIRRIRLMVVLAALVSIANGMVLLVYLPWWPGALALAGLVAFFICAMPIVAAAHVLEAEQTLGGYYREALE